MATMLPINTNIPITQHTVYAMPLSIILSRKENALWSYTHFIQICSIVQTERDFGSVELYYTDLTDMYTDILAVDKITDDEASSVSMLVYLSESLEENKYLFIRLDSYYLKAKSSYKRRHHLQSSLIYGYDSCKCEFYAMSFDSGNLYASIVISYNELLSAFKNAIKIKLDAISKGENPLTPLLSRYSLLPSCDFDVCIQIKKQLNDYIESRSLERISPLLLSKGEIPATGIQAYKKYLDYIRQEIKSGEFSSYHSIHLFWEHKKLIHERLQYLQMQDETNINLDEYRNIVQASDAVRLRYIKSAITGPDNSLYGRITSIDVLNQLLFKMEEIVRKEELLLRDL